MKNNPNSPTRSTEDAHAGQPSDDKYLYYSPANRLPVCPYSRRKALADGLQKEVSREYLEFLHRDWDMLLTDRVFLTKKVIECCEISDTPIKNPVSCPLFEIQIAVEAVIGSSPDNPTAFKIRSGATMRGPFVEFLAVWTTADIDDPMPVVTVMLPEEL